MDIEIYLFRFAILLCSFYVLYQVFLARDTHYQTNRLFLLFGIGTASLLPIAEIKYRIFIKGGIQPAFSNDFTPVKNETITTMGTIGQATQAIDWSFVVIAIYLGVATILLLRIGFQIGKMILLKKSGVHHNWQGMNICINPNIETPFTFYKTIYLKDTSILNDVNDGILRHESIHLSQKHWFDILLAELVIVVQWFNPLAWLYAQSVRQNLEFIADNGVLKSGHRMDKYIHSILCVTMGTEAIVLANYFRISHNKNRLNMMKKARSSKWKQFKLLVAIPTIGIGLWAFSAPVYEVLNDEVIELNVKQAPIKREIEIKGRVLEVDTMYISNPVPEQKDMQIVKGVFPGTSVVIKGTTAGTVTDKEGRFKLKVAKGDVIVFSFVGFKTQEVTIKGDEDVIIYHKAQSYKLNPKNYAATPATNKPSKLKESDNDEPMFFVVEALPNYKGGMHNYFLKLSEKSATLAEDKAIKGTVDVKLRVTANGDLVGVKAMDANDSRLAKIAEELVSSLNEWQPAQQRGKNVPCSLIVPVKF